MECLPHLEGLRPKRAFLPENFSIKDTELLKNKLENLIKRPVISVDQLETWLDDRDEFEQVVDEACSLIEIDYSCYTEDSQKEADYLFLVQHVKPLLMVYDFKLNQKYIECSERSKLDREYYEMHDKLIENQITLFREENVPLATKEEEAADVYSKITGSLTVSFEGKEYTVPQMAPFTLDPDRSIREAAFRTTGQVYNGVRKELEQVFDTLRPIRNEISKNVGFNSYTDYMFAAKSRFDYTPETCFSFHQAIEEQVLPVLQKIHSKKAEQMGVSALRPWDMSVDALGRPALKPFTTAQDLISGVQKTCHQLHPIMGKAFDRLAEYKTLDLESRKGKRPGGYQADLPDSQVQFIFMNAVGIHDDLITLLHETGHAIHSNQANEQKRLMYRSYPIEMAEVASMAMELLSMEGYGHFYNEADAQRAKEDQLYRVISVLPWVATVDAFQHWLYANPKHSAKQRCEAWLRIYHRFQPDVEWGELEESLAFRWHRQLHIFLVPHYYIEYGISQVGALQVWCNYLENRDNGLEQFLSGLTLGYSKPLPELYKGAGIEFQFDSEMLKRVMEPVSRMLCL